MARPLRIEFPGAIYHIIQRGVEGINIFETHRDREKFFEYISDAFLKYNCLVHAYCLMSTHYHLILQTMKANLSKVMHYLNTGYATYSNIKRERGGPLFRGRYKSILVQEGEYLQHLSRYIHLNPVKAKIVKEPLDYPYSSLKYFTGRGQLPDWLYVDMILGEFHHDRAKAMEMYTEFATVEKGEQESKKIIEDNIRHGIILGDDEYFEWIRKTFIDRRNDQEIPVLGKLQIRPEIDQIASMTSSEIKDPMLQRDLLIYLARKYTDKRLKQIAEFANLGYSAVSKIYSKTEKTRKKDKSLDKYIQKIEGKLLAMQDNEG